MELDYVQSIRRWAEVDRIKDEEAQESKQQKRCGTDMEIKRGLQLMN